MIRRYNLERSDNIPYTGKKAYTCTGNGYITVRTGFPVNAASITWCSLPNYDAPFEMSSSSSSTSSSSSIDSSSSSSSSYGNSSLSSESSGAGDMWIWYDCYHEMSWVITNYPPSSIPDPFVFGCFAAISYDPSPPEGSYAPFGGYSGAPTLTKSGSNYIITGTTDPKTRGLYSSVGTFCGVPYYQHVPEFLSSSSSRDSSSSSSSSRADVFYIWYDSQHYNIWIVGPTLGAYGGATWYKDTYPLPPPPTPTLGTYLPLSPASGSLVLTQSGNSYIATGDTRPESHGTYIYAGQYNDAPYYANILYNSSSSSSSSSLTSNEYPGPFNKPRIYVYSYLNNGFVVKYENIPEEVGFVEFSYLAV